MVFPSSQHAPLLYIETGFPMLDETTYQLDTGTKENDQNSTMTYRYKDVS